MDRELRQHLADTAHGVFAVFYALIASLPLYVVTKLAAPPPRLARHHRDGLRPGAGPPFAEPILAWVGRARLALAVLLFALNVSCRRGSTASGGCTRSGSSTACGRHHHHRHRRYRRQRRPAPAARRGHRDTFAMATNVAVVIGPFVSLVLVQRISFPCAVHHRRRRSSPLWRRSSGSVPG